MFNFMAHQIIGYMNQGEGVRVFMVLGVVFGFLSMIGLIHYQDIKRDFPKRYKFVLTPMIALGTWSLIFIALMTLINNPNNYEIGMCFNRIEKVEHWRSEEEVNQILTQKTQALAIATKIKADNKSQLASEVSSLAHELDNYPKPETLNRPVIILSQNNGNLYFDQERNEVKTNFNIQYGYYPIKCSPELKKVVSHYQSTGKNLTVSK